MMFDQSWMADILELQKKAAELAKSPNSTAEVQNSVKEFLHQWGIDRFPWEESTSGESIFWAGGAAEPVAKANWNIDITETKHQVMVETLIPGIAAPHDLVIKLQGEMLMISGKSEAVPTDNPVGAFFRQARLPAEVTAAGAQASYREDKLTITLPKRTAELEETIPVHYFESK